MWLYDIRWCTVLLCLCWVPYGVSAAQDVTAPAPDVPRSQAGAEPTLPEVLVRPEEQPAKGAPSTTSQAGGGPYDLPLSYPSLSQIRFDGLGSALRSNTSIFRSPRAISVVSPEDLSERQPRDMIEALQREVGVLMQRTGSGQASPFIRGLTGPQTLILVDGIRLNNSTFRYGPNQYFATIDPGMVERIEVVRGPQSVLWGSDAIGGVINVVTRSADTRFRTYRGGEFIERFSTADTGSYSRLSIEGSRGCWGVFGGASYLNVDNLERGGGLGRQPMTDYTQFGGDVKLDYLLSPTQMLTVALQHNQQNNVPRTDKWPKEARRFDPQMRDLGYVRWQGTDVGGLFCDSFMVTASFHRQEERALRRKPPTSATVDIGDFDCGTTGLNVVLGRDLGWAGSLTYGLDWYHDEVNATKTRYDAASGSVVKSLVPQFPDDSYYQRVGAFLQWDVDVTQRLGAVAGVRYTNIDAGATVENFDTSDPNFPNVAPIFMPISPSFQDWTGSVGLRYELAEDLHLVGSVAEGFRAPDLDELTSVSDNVFDDGVDLPSVGLHPETSINYEVGLKFNYPRLRAQMFHFWTNLEGLTRRRLVLEKGGIRYYRRENIGLAELTGVELDGEYLLTTEWSVYGNFWTVYGQDRTDDEPLRRIPPRQGVLGLRWRNHDHSRWLECYAWMVAKQDRLSPGDVSDSRIPPGGTPGYTTLNIRAGTRIGQRQRIMLGIENVTDRAYRVHGSGVDGPGISGNLAYELIY